ncbi:MAG TPA: HD domain-containing protein [Allosphingosinicella sp.]|nr:HD domain-containing protein [Allosphingosinicella sp.]
MLTDRFDDALAYASRIHRDQRRKGTDIPYVSHLLAVASLTLEHGGDEDQAIAALLHDAAEDQGGAARLADIEARFGGGVAGIVADCTDSWVEPKPPWRERKRAYVEALPGKPARSLLVSLADKTHNARAIVADLRRHGADLWPRFTGGEEGTLWYYGALAAAFAGALPGHLADELGRAVAAMRAA